MRQRIAIFSVKGDLHGLVVQEALRERGVDCHFVATNDLLATGGLSWTMDSDRPARVRSDEGEWFDVRELDAIWWRRTRYEQLPHPFVQHERELNLATTEWRSALAGALLSEFEGTWINHPEASVTAEHKIVQLKAARGVGLRLPPTYVGQDPAALRAFCSRHELDALVIKKVRGTLDTPLLTVRITRADLADEASIRLCPAIYQAEIPGDRHLRIHVLGDRANAVMIEAQELDWRPNLNVPMCPYSLQPRHVDQLVALNRRLGLRMSIMDAKLDGDDLIWIEANPQGAFLFAHALADDGLVSTFCDFLQREADAGRCRRTRVAA